MNYQNLPPSAMLRVPTSLIPAVRELSRLHRQGHTKALLQALQDLIITFDSGIDSDSALPSNAVQNIEIKLDNIEAKLTDKLEVINSKLEQLSRTGALNSPNARGYHKQNRSNSYYPHQQPTVELTPYAHENLAQRLGLSAQTLFVEREKLTTKEFITYTRNRDPRSFGWEWSEVDNLYYPISALG